ncbi:MAG: hypothetical protein R2824_27910 [Saprospiraceae bacterium]
MDLQQAKVLLTKITTLHDSMSLDNGPIASIERDLMLSYIRQLYEAYQDISSNGKITKSTAAAPSAKTAGPELEIVPPSQEREVVPEPPQRRYTPPKIIEIPDPTPEPVKVAPPPPAPKPTPPPPVATPKPAASAGTNAKVRALFDQKEARELSEKLSLQPLKDLTKGLSINDRLLYTNDLFNKNTDNFNEALRTLNNKDSMDTARSYLEQLAMEYNWTDGEKEDVAKDFIKHIRRRFV